MPVIQGIGELKWRFAEHKVVKESLRPTAQQIARKLRETPEANIEVRAGGICYSTRLELFAPLQLNDLTQKEGGILGLQRPIVRQGGIKTDRMGGDLEASLLPRSLTTALVSRVAESAKMAIQWDAKIAFPKRVLLKVVDASPITLKKLSQAPDDDQFDWIDRFCADLNRLIAEQFRLPAP